MCACGSRFCPDARPGLALLLFLLFLGASILFSLVAVPIYTPTNSGGGFIGWNFGEKKNMYVHSLKINSPQNLLIPPLTIFSNEKKWCGVPSDTRHWKQHHFCGIHTKKYILNLAMKKNQRNPNWKKFYKITDLYILQKCKIVKNKENLRKYRLKRTKQTWQWNAMRDFLNWILNHKGKEGRAIILLLLFLIIIIIIIIIIIFGHTTWHVWS